MSTWLEHEMPRYLAKYYFWVYLWGYLLMKLAFESVASVKQLPLSNMPGHHPSHWGPKQNKKVEEGRIWLFLPACLSWKVDLFLPSVLLALRSSNSDWITPPAFPRLQLAGDTKRPLSLHNWMSQFLRINLTFVENPDKYKYNWLTAGFLVHSWHQESVQ